MESSVAYLIPNFSISLTEDWPNEKSDKSRILLKILSFEDNFLLSFTPNSLRIKLFLFKTTAAEKTGPKIEPVLLHQCQFQFYSSIDADDLLLSS